MTKGKTIKVTVGFHPDAIGDVFLPDSIIYAMEHQLVDVKPGYLVKPDGSLQLMELSIVPIPLHERQPSLKATFLEKWLYPLLNRFVHCDMACEWVYPYGFVPEAGCPVHDKGK